MNRTRRLAYGSLVFLSLTCAVLTGIQFTFGDLARVGSPSGLDLWTLVLAVVIAFLLLLYEWTQGRRLAPEPPQGPLQSDPFKPLLPKWRRHLYGPVPMDEPTPGAKGENAVVGFLRFLDDGYLVTYRPLLETNHDVDVVLVGPKGCPG